MALVSLPPPPPARSPRGAAGRPAELRAVPRLLEELVHLARHELPLHAVVGGKLLDEPLDERVLRRLRPSERSLLERRRSAKGAWREDSCTPPGQLTMVGPRRGAFAVPGARNSVTRFPRAVVAARRGRRSGCVDVLSVNSCSWTQFAMKHRPTKAHNAQHFHVQQQRRKKVERWQAVKSPSRAAEGEGRSSGSVLANSRRRTRLRRPCAARAPAGATAAEKRRQDAGGAVGAAQREAQRRKDAAEAERAEARRLAEARQAEIGARARGEGGVGAAQKADEEGPAGARRADRVDARQD